MAQNNVSDLQTTLGNADPFAKKDGRNSLAGIQHEVHGHEPGTKRQFGGDRGPLGILNINAKVRGEGRE